ncbi:YhgE/Pip family protein [Homoserinimonas hongtaonis]|uniref:YhgE/Pip domain-containing protein n=1 Tax=Homoserinimonas hongtaonis TaxID=2079791 RepID=A0A2U1SWU3_9MICO|nr:YhgE/Pip family protein [Salinibacterium hongtaonis]PWB96105.1 YhgE/Pip domain-containing protein [Salinibacterium hongtaonis]
MTGLRTTSSARSPRQRVGRLAAILAVVAVPLAFAGLAIGALSESDTATSRVPAAIVNNDQLIYQTAADGTESPIFAGRQLVTELTGSDDGFDWVITNEDKAEKALADGEVFAVVTIPEDFSEALISVQGENPRTTALDIRTDDSHSYLSGVLSSTIGDGVATAFGSAITEQVIAGLYSGVGDLGSSLGSAAEGAGTIASAGGELSSGLSTLQSGIASAQTGATTLSSGITRYTEGVDSLSRGLGTLNSSAGKLDQLSSGVSAYTAGIGQLSQQVAAMAAANPGDATAAALAPQLAYLAGQGSELSAQTASGIDALQGGISQSASGAAQLASGSSALRSGARSLASGLGELRDGAGTAADGAGALASGAQELATGLSDGAGQVPSVEDAEERASIVANPVTAETTRNNEIGDLAAGVSSLLVPLGLWMGALAVFLVLRPVARRALTSSASTGRLLWSGIAKAAGITVAQAVVLTAVLHLVLDTSWIMLPATLGFAVLTALSFTAVHYLLTTAFGRAGLVVSLLLLAVQITSTGGLYPVQLLSGPFAAISPLLPLTHAVAGMQSIISGGTAGVALGSAAVLAAYAIGAVLLSVAALGRVRRIRSLAALPLPA